MVKTRKRRKVGGKIRKKGRRIKTPKAIGGKVRRGKRRGGILPALATLAPIAAPVIGGIAGIAGMINKIRTNNKLLTETMRHNKAIEASLAARGKGLHRSNWVNPQKKKKLPGNCR